jgi:DNA-binding XRE family transcriptional regulator
MTGEELRAAYINRGFSRRGFAEHVDVPEQSLRRLEVGERVHPATAKKVADELGVRVTDLMPLEAA